VFWSSESEVGLMSANERERENGQSDEYSCRPAEGGTWSLTAGGSIVTTWAVPAVEWW